MRDLDLKESLAQGKVTIGSWITLGHPAIPEIMAKAGFDWLTVDMEHSAITLDRAQELIRVIELAGIVPLVRLSANEPTLIKRVMDAGAHGVIVPMVNTAEEAASAVAAVKYPPAGTRGVGLARAQGYGLDFPRYREWAGESSVVIVQIEHIDAVENLEEIVAVEGVDGFIVGPYDLSGSLGVPGELDHPDVTDALGRIMDIAKQTGTVAGFHVVPPDPAQADAKIEEGYRFIGFCLDTLFLARMCVDETGRIRRPE